MDIGINGESAKKKVVHIVAMPYPAQGHIVPLMQLCRKLAREEGVMVTFVNTMHNHTRMLQAELDASPAKASIKEAHHEERISMTCSTNHFINNTSTDRNSLGNAVVNQTNCNELTRSIYSSKSATNPKGMNNLTNVSVHHLDDNYEVRNHNIRLVGIPGGLPPELHSDPVHIIATFLASEALCEPFEKLLEKLNQEGPPVSCIISDVLVSWTQGCAETIGVPRYAFWTSSAAVYHVIWHMYGLISKGIPTFKAPNAIFEGNNTEMVSCIPGLPVPMCWNDLPIIVRSDPADFIYQFLTRQLKPMERATAVLFNTFFELEAHCLQALPATSPSPIYSIGPLLPTYDIALHADVDGETDGRLHAATCRSAEPTVTLYMKADTKILTEEDTRAETVDASSDGRGDHACANPDGGALKAAKAAGKAGLAGGKASCFKVGRGQRAGVHTAGIFSEDVSCLEWLAKRKARSVLYISFGSIFSMSSHQFMELATGLQASKQAFLWSIRPSFVQGTSSYTHALPPSFLEETHDRGLLVSWVPQLTVLAHPAIAGFLTHCGWNSTLESVALGVPMLCWPDVGERRTNGRLAVSLWKAGLEFSYSNHKNGIISREEVKRVILLLMDPRSPTASHLRSNAAALKLSARLAQSRTGSSSHNWNLFLDHLRHS